MENSFDLKKVMEGTTKNCHDIIKTRFGVLQYKAEIMKIGKQTLQNDLDKFLENIEGY